MTLRAEPASIAALSRTLDSTTQSGGKPKVPTIDAGPSTASVQATIAELLRAEAGLAEITGRTAHDLDANKDTYASTEAGNEDLFRPIGQSRPSGNPQP